jgi:hypothetical protein
MSNAYRRPTRRRWVPVLEQLETRAVPAGNVTAAVIGGDLVLHGDDAGADITLSQPAPGQITVVGNDTNVNGASDPVTLSVSRGLRATFGAGNDSLTFDLSDPISFAGPVSVNGGAGSNTVSTDSFGPEALSVRGDLTIVNLAGGPQLTFLGNLNVKGDVRVLNQGGDAITQIEPFDGTNTIGGDLVVANGPGNSQETDLRAVNVKHDVRLVNQANVAVVSVNSFAAPNTIGGDFSVFDGPASLAATDIGGTQVGHDLRVRQDGAEQNTLILRNDQVKHDTHLRTGDGDATVLVNGSTFGGDFHLKTGAGADTVNLGTGGAATLVRLVAVEVVVIENGVPVVQTRVKAVPEEVLLTGGPVTFNDEAKVDLGAGDDTLNLALDAVVTFKKQASLDGRGGTNVANVHAANVVGTPGVKHFAANQV